MNLQTNYNILIIDDSTFILSIVERVLLKEFKNITLHKAQSYSEACEISDKVFFHAAIVDVTLPDTADGDAVDLTISLGIPTIVLTGTDDTQLQENILSKNIFDLILKNNSNNLPYVVFSIKRILKNYSTNVLIVDDSKSTRNLIAKLLRKLHLTVHEAEDPIEAFEILADPSHTIAMVITDYEMPHMNGLEFVLMLRQTYRKDRLSIIALSAAGDKGLSANFIKHGANDFLHKPFDQDELYVRINSNLELLEMFEQKQEIITKDYLTGLSNRHFFFEQAQSHLNNAKKNNLPVSLSVFDIDHIKTINETYDYQAGDILIKEVSNLLRSQYPDETLIARFGGEKMYVLSTEATTEEAFHHADSVRKKALVLRVPYKNDILSLTLSGGIYHGVPESLFELFETANKNLKKAKEMGKNKIVAPNTFNSVNTIELEGLETSAGEFDLLGETVLFE